MSKISDELRKIADECLTGTTNERVRRLAVRIDAEMVELPRDADGKPIHVGDTVYLDDGRVAEVTHIDLMWGTSCIACFARGKDHDCFPSGISHTRPDSWERIADELEAKASSCGHQGFAVVSRDEVAEIAARIRALAVKGDWR